MSKKIKKVLEIKTLIFGILVMGCLLYYLSKYYEQGELIFLKNQFTFFIGFVLIVMWIMIYLIYQNNEIRKQHKEIQNQYNEINRQQNKIQENNEVIKDLINHVIEEQTINHDNIIKFQRNTRQLILESLSSKNEGV